MSEQRDGDSRVLEEGRRFLAACRADRGAWVGFAYAEGVDEWGDEYDTNEIARHKLLVALQYDRRHDDRALVRFLLAEEIRAHEKSVYQGLGDSLKLAAYLLATYREVENVWLFLEAKRANFDTECGFDREYLVSAGVELTMAYVRGSGHAMRDLALEYLTGNGAPLFDAAALSGWWEAIRKAFPETEAQEEALTLVNRAHEFGHVDEARRRLERWASEQPANEKTFGLLRHYWTSFGDLDRAIEVQRRLLDELRLSAWDTVSNLQNLADLLRRARRYDDAWRALQACDPHIPELEWFNEVGLGRSSVETAFDIAREAEPGNASGHEAFRWADSLLEHGCSTSPLILSKAIHAADRVGDEKAANRYRKRARKEGVDENLVLKFG